MPEKKTVPPEYFTQAPEVLAALQQLAATFDGPAPLIITKNWWIRPPRREGYQYVNLVRKAEASGYCPGWLHYLLEKAGIVSCGWPHQRKAPSNTTLLQLLQRSQYFRRLREIFRGNSLFFRHNLGFGILQVNYSVKYNTIRSSSISLH